MNAINFGFISKWFQFWAPGHNSSRKEEKTGNVGSGFFANVKNRLNSIGSILGVGLLFSTTDRKTNKVALGIFPQPKMQQIFQNAIKPERILEEFGAKILPKYKIKLEGKATYYVSNPFKYKEHEVRFLYVKTNDEQIHLQMAYLNHSQGIWRVAPDRNGESFGKGYCEIDTALPIDVSLKLSKLPKEKKQKLKDIEFNQFLNPSSNNYYQVMRAKEEGFLSSVKNEPSLKNYKNRNARYWTPEEMKIADPNQEPDFDNAETVKDSDLYKNATLRKIPSKDGNLLYLFIDDKKGAFISTIEYVNAEITKFGNREKFPDAGNMMMSIREGSHLPYLHSAQEYINEIELIQRYRRQFLSK